jgi:hypothetical protein
MKKKSLLSEVRQLQKIAGILKEAIDVNSVIAKHEGALLAALKARQANPEDIDAHNKVKSHLETIADELGLDSTIPFMEDEMYSGRVSPEKALQYTKEMFNDWVQETL